MMNKAWSSIEEVPYCFSRSSVKFQGHTALKIVEFDPNWAYPDCNSSWNSPMATKWCTKLEVAWKRCPIVFQGHPSNCKVTRLKKSSILTQIRHFRTVTPVWIHQWQGSQWSGKSQWKKYFFKVSEKSVNFVRSQWILWEVSEKLDLYKSQWKVGEFEKRPVSETKIVLRINTICIYSYWWRPWQISWFLNYQVCHRLFMKLFCAFF